MEIITHSDAFHYDEILGIALLKHIYKEKIVKITRSRDSFIIERGDIVLDVGGVFDPISKRFDHHQSTFFETFSDDFNVKLSSSGLIFKYFCDELFELYHFSKNNKLYEKIKKKIYTDFFLYADAIDNGYDIFGNIVPRTMCSFVSGFNLNKLTNSYESIQNQNKQFFKVLDIVQEDLDNYLKYIFDKYIQSYSKVYSDLERIEGEIYFSEINPVLSLIHDTDMELGTNIKFVIYKKSDGFRILTLPVKKNSFTPRLPLLKEWCGLRGKDLCDVSGIPGCIFVHANGFTGANRTYTGALDMCYKTLETNKLK